MSSTRKDYFVKLRRARAFKPKGKVLSTEKLDELSEALGQLGVETDRKRLAAERRERTIAAIRALRSGRWHDRNASEDVASKVSSSKP